MDIKKDNSASVLTKLLNHSRSQKEDYQSLLIRYVAERFLYRLGESSYRDNYILKGAYLLTIILDDLTYRTTKDIDFLKTGNTETDYILESLKEICSIQYPEDAVKFDYPSISLHDIREQNAYRGQRAKIQARIGKAKVMLQIDIGIGDSIYPSIVQKGIQSILEMDNPEIEVYPLETIIAEKLEAIIALSILTSRMKDFYDLYIITKSCKLIFNDVSFALKQTFSCRNTTIPTSVPIVFSEKIIHDKVKQKQWKAFVGKLRNEHFNLPFEEVIFQLAKFSQPFWNQGKNEFHTWNPDSGWQ